MPQSFYYQTASDGDVPLPFLPLWHCFVSWYHAPPLIALLDVPQEASPKFHCTYARFALKKAAEVGWIIKP